MRYAANRIAITLLTAMLLLCGVVQSVTAQEERKAGDWAVLRQQSFGNLRQIMIAMHTYHDTYKSYPPAYVSKNGKPLLSWRVALLPFLEGVQLQDAFHLDEPWDSDHNEKLIEQMPLVYRSPASQAAAGRTVYLTPRGEATAFPGEAAVPIRQIIDGTSQTLAVIEVDDEQAAIWTKPDDWPFDPQFPKIGFRGQYPEGLNTATCDGAVHYLRLNIEDDVLKALLTRAGREPVGIRDLRPRIVPPNLPARSCAMNAKVPRVAYRVLPIVLGLLLVVASPLAAEDERTPADWAQLREQSNQQLQEMALALLNHHDVYKRFPPAYRADKSGRPLLSWRVAILPFLEEQALYQEFHHDEPWDSDHNKKLIERMPAVYRSPASKLDDSRTVYLTPRGDATAFPGGKAKTVRDIRDGTSKTIANLEVDDEQAVIWTRPDDWTVDAEHPKVGFRGQYPQGANTVFLDSSRHFISHDVDEGTLKALLTCDGREPIQLPK